MILLLFLHHKFGKVLEGLVDRHHHEVVERRWVLFVLSGLDAVEVVISCFFVPAAQHDSERTRSKKKSDTLQNLTKHASNDIHHGNDPISVECCPLSSDTSECILAREGNCVTRDRRNRKALTGLTTKIASRLLSKIYRMTSAYELMRKDEKNCISIDLIYEATIGFAEGTFEM